MGSGVTTAGEVAEALQIRWRFKEPPATPERFLGIQFRVSKHGIFWDKKPLAEALARLVPQGLMETLLNLPFPRQIHPIEDKAEAEVAANDVLRDKAHTPYRSLLGMIAYLQHTRIDLLFAISFFGQFGSAPTRSIHRHLMCAAAFAAQTTEYRLSFPRHSDPALLGDFTRMQPSDRSKAENWLPVEPRAWHFDVFSDATYRQGKEKALSGYVVCLNRQVIAMRACKQRRRAH